MTGSKNHPGGWVGRTPWSAADAPVGPLALCMVLISLALQRDEGVPRGPGGPPHHLPSQRRRPVFHRISRAEGPFKQTTKGDGLSHLSEQYCLKVLFGARAKLNAKCHTSPAGPRR